MRRHSFHIADWRVPRFDRLLELHAELAAIVDPAFATCASWPSTRIAEGSYGPPDDRSYGIETRYADGARAVLLEQREWQGFTGQAETQTIGLPAGFALALRAETSERGCEVIVELELPDAIADAVIAHCPR